jgi:hypothetical protein
MGDMRARVGVIGVLATLVAGVGGGVARADGGPIMPLSQVQTGMNCTAYTVIQGTTISSFDVQVLGIVNQSAGQGARIFVSVSGPAVAASGIAEGFSGSPVYCPAQDGTMENIGAISEGVGQYGNNVGLVTPIQQMLGEPVDPPSSAPHTDFKTTPLLGPLTFGGLSPSLMGLVEKAGRRAGRLVVAAPDGYIPSFPVQQLVPGASVAASYSTGVIAVGAIGTVTYRDGNDVYVFGHELDGAGRRSLYLQDAYVFGVIDNPDPTLEPSYKLAAPGHTLGTITSDTPNAVIGTVGAPPGQIPIDVTAHDLDTGQTITEDTDVADETAVGYPLGSSLLDIVAPVAIGQAAIDVYNGPPASESGTMCLTIHVREQSTDLHFCDRYVGTGAAGDNGEAPPEVSNGASTDVSSALSLLDEVQFATLHVTSVTADIRAARGLAEASILGASGPRRVKPGQRITVGLRVQLYRAGFRTIALHLRVPRGASGLVPVAIKGATPLAPGSANGGESLTAALTIALGGGGPSASSTPKSLADLRKEFAAIPPYDGISVRFGAHGQSRPTYRDPSLLITGAAKVLLDVAGGKAHKRSRTASGRTRSGKFTGKFF